MSEREQNGRFGKGNQAAKGNNGGRPARPKEEQYLAILLKACTAEDWEKIVVSAVTHAKAGDSKAREWLSNYIIGKAVERHEITGAIEVDHSVDASDIAEALAILGATHGCQSCGS